MLAWGWAPVRCKSHGKQPGADPRSEVATSRLNPGHWQYYQPPLLRSLGKSCYGMVWRSTAEVTLTQPRIAGYTELLLHPHSLLGRAIKEYFLAILGNREMLNEQFVSGSVQHWIKPFWSFPSPSVLSLKTQTTGLLSIIVGSSTSPKSMQSLLSLVGCWDNSYQLNTNFSYTELK